MRGDAEDVHSAGTHLHDEQDVQPLQADGVDVEEVGGEQTARLGLEEHGPLAAHQSLARSRAQACGTKDTTDGRRADPVPEAPQFSVDAPETPSGLLGAEPDGQVAQLFGDRRPTR
ncbi:hypothetical protein OG873_36240 [Streptomyces violaceus]|uniref:hypothetical protein n=1 Tax=Streptomyces violaceus TaxID=1936 RepID=UPI002E2BE4F7|nr:hypothetical protein [Streptomyces violaceus]